MPFVFNGLVLSQQNIPMDLNLFFSLLHRHFQLVLLVLQSVYMVCRPVQTFLYLLNLQFHNVMLHQNVFFLLCYLVQSLNCHVIF